MSRKNIALLRAKARALSTTVPLVAAALGAKYAQAIAVEINRCQWKGCARESTRCVGAGSGYKALEHGLKLCQRHAQKWYHMRRRAEKKHKTRQNAFWDSIEKGVDLDRYGAPICEWSWRRRQVIADPGWWVRWFRLSKREASILCMHAFGDMSFEDAGRLFHVCGTRARQIEQKALRKIGRRTSRATLRDMLQTGGPE